MIRLGFLALVFLSLSAPAAQLRTGICAKALTGVFQREVFDHALAESLIGDQALATAKMKTVRLVLSGVELSSPDIKPPRESLPRLYYGHFNHKSNEQIEARMLEMSQLGFVLEGSEYRGATLTMLFKRDERLVRLGEQQLEPPWVEKQIERLKERFPSARFRRRMPPSALERYYWDKPESDILTSKSLQKINPGMHSFVLLVGENFLRLGPGHPKIGARELANAAGDIEIRKNPATGLNEVVSINPRSDTYRPMSDSLPAGVEALWRQGIYSPRLKLFEWNNKTLLIDLSVIEKPHVSLD